MSYITEETKWPSGLDDATRALIVRLFELSDTPRADSGKDMAEEVFTHDAVFSDRNGLNRGSQEICKCREGVWSAVDSMKHRLLQVFVKDDSHQELIMLGKLKVTPKNADEMHFRFAIHALVDRLSAHELRTPKLKQVQVFQVEQEMV